jgi:hypothetical protein
VTELSTGPPGRPSRGSWLDWLLVVGISALCGWVGLMAMFYLPLYAGPVPLPVSVLLAVGAMVLGPRTAYRLTGSLIAALLPVLAWFGVTVWMTLNRNDIMPTAPLTVTSGQWRVMLLLGLGALAAAATIGLVWGDRLRERIRREQAAAVAGAADRAGA